MFKSSCKKGDTEDKKVLTDWLGGTYDPKAGFLLGTTLALDDLLGGGCRVYSYTSTSLANFEKSDYKITPLADA